MTSSAEEYVSTLNKETQDKAAKELKENEETRNEDIQMLRERVEKTEGVYFVWIQLNQDWCTGPVNGWPLISLNLLDSLNDA